MNIKSFFKVFILLAVVAAIISFPFYKFMNFEPLVSAIIGNLYSNFEASDNKSDILYKIDGKYIGKKSGIVKQKIFLEKWLNMTSEIPLNEYIDSSLNQDLIILEALDDKTLNNESFKNYIEFQLRNSIVQYYLKKKIEEENNEFKKITVSQREVDDHYNQYKDVYKGLNLSKDKINLLIKNSIMNEKRKHYILQYQNQLLNSIKLKRKIEFN